jgi:ELWxxDGT repeat protein
MASVNGILFFTAWNDTYGTELWKSDGTAGGTVLLKDIFSGSLSSEPNYLTAADGRLFFTADDRVGSRKLWQTDGTSAGTVAVTDLPSSSFANIDGTLFFAASDGVHGQELWKLVDYASQSTGLSVSGFSTSVTAGSAGSFTVTAKNADGSTNAGYRGKVHFTSSDLQAVLPADYAFTALDQGVHTFSATLKTAGSQSITATDTATAAITATQSVTVNAAAASRLILSAPASVSSGASFSLSVTIVDAYGNVAKGYQGKVALSSFDSTATVPKNYNFTAADAGVHFFTGMKLKKKGKQFITMTDTQDGSITGTVVIDVR